MATLQTIDASAGADASGSTSSIDWRSIIAGSLTATALSVVLFGFGGALGLSLTSARPYAGLSTTSMAILSAIWLALVYVSTFAAGGYIAGRMRAPMAKNAKDRDFRDGTHGFLVWALGTLLGAYVIATTLSSAASKTVDAAARVSEVAGQVSTAAASSTTMTNLLAYNVDAMLRPSGPAATPSGPQAPPQPLPPRDLADVTRIFAMSLANGALSPRDREYLATIVASRTGTPTADAGRRVDEAYTTVSTKTAEMEAKVRAAAETTRKAGILTGFLAAAVALVGMLAAAWAANAGGRDRDEGRELSVFGQKRLW